MIAYSIFLLSETNRYFITSSISVSKDITVPFLVDTKTGKVWRYNIPEFQDSEKFSLLFEP